MISRSIYIATTVTVLSVIGGFYMGKSFSKSPHRHQPLAQNTAQAQTPNPNFASQFRMINPFIDCIRSKGLKMKELKSFKTKIEEYLNTSVKNKEITVSYLFRDMNNGMWFGIREKEEFSPASLMKVPNMIAILKEAESNPEILTRKLQYHAADVPVNEESGFPKKEGEWYTVEELLIQSIEWSDNAANYMLRKTLGREKLIRVEDDLNLHVRPEVNSQTNFVSVKQFSALFRILYNAGYLNEEMSQKALELLTSSKYKNGIRSAVPSEITVAHKYGKRYVYEMDHHSQTIQLHHFGLVYYPGKSYTIGVMTRGGSEAEKEKIIYDLSKMTYDEVNRQMIENQNKKAPVSNPSS